jgi:pimeloyl-ACP methyl ester carboxylesterase
MDLRGHGESTPAKNGDYAVATFAADVAALIEHLDIAPAVVVGHSLGGVITCAVSAARPDLVAAAVMVDPAPFVIRDELRPVIDALFKEIASKDGEAARARMVGGMFLATDDAERKAWIVNTMAQVPQEIAAPSIGGLLTFDGPRALASVQCPIASISANGPVDDARLMKKANPRLLVGQTLGAGHFNQLEVPDQVNDMIGHFLAINGLAKR